MASTMSKSDILAVSASGVATKKLHLWLQNVRADLVSLAQSALVCHQGIDDGALEARDDATTLDTAITLANSLRSKVVAHLVSVGSTGAHTTESAQAIAAPVATDLATAIALVNELATDHDAHCGETPEHLQADATNLVGAGDATDEATLIERVNLVKTKYNLHVAAALTAAYVA